MPFYFLYFLVSNRQRPEEKMINEDILRETCASNPDKGFRMLMESFQQPVYWHIRRMVVSHDDAEDVLQETFIRIFRYLGDFRAESALSTWI